MGTEPFENVAPNDEVMQNEADPRAVPVTIDTPVQTREVPAEAAGLITTNIDVTGERLLPADPRRKSVTLYAWDQEVRLGTAQSAVRTATGNAPNGARWPKLVPIVLTTSEELWVASATATTDLSVIVENWAR